MIDAVLDDDAIARERAALDRTWAERRGLIGWLSSVDHKAIGRRFIVTCFVYFALGGLLALTMRLQLARPENHLVSADLYAQVFTMHGTVMMFLFATPIMLGLAVYVVPLMIGARAIAFPRLVAFGYWMILFGGIFLFSMFVLNTGPDNGWFNYVPLSGPEYGIGKRADTWAQFITFSELSSLVVAIALLTTILKLRAPGMAIHQVPIYVWSIAVISAMVIFAMPAVMLASTSLILDRLVGTHLFNQAEGGDALLWQHLFWFFGHPEVYIIFLPAQGMMSTLLATFSGRPAYGYLALVLSLVATAFIGFGVWVHHMFTTGLPQLGQSFFTAASIMIVVPSGVQFFCWLATLWTGKLRFTVPMLWALSFFAVFLIGGLTGVMIAAVPLDRQVHDTYFIVAHFHYVLIGGAVFPLLGAIHYWFPKMTGRMLSERLGRISWAIFFVGFNLTFFPMHLLGLRGMPRRVYTYQPEMGWAGMNMLATAGGALMGVALLVYLINAMRSGRRGEVAADAPWRAATLEWATSSPPPPYNFAPIPVAPGRDPLWTLERPLAGVTGVAADCRQILATTINAADPDHRPDSPEPSIWPFVTAVATSAMFVWSIFWSWAVVWGSIPIAIALIAWFWPHDGQRPRDLKARIARGQHAPLEQTT
jgi:cytochrome c oxidase subunit 1